MKFIFKELSAKRFFLIITIPLSIIMSLVIAVNYFMDPLWFFGNGESFKKKVDNLREYKTNFFFNNDKGHESIFIGNSRASYLSTANFKEKTFNYAADGM